MPKSAKTKQSIIAASARIFNTKGFAGTSMNDIMQATGLTKGGLYGNFESKTEIAAAAFEYSVATTNAEIRRRTSVIESIPDKLKAVVYFYKENILNPPIDGGCPILNTSVEADDTHPALREHARAALQEWMSHLAYTLRKGIERGELLPTLDSDAFATSFTCTLEGGIMIARLLGDSTAFVPVADDLLARIRAITV